jgi:tartrate dehydratase beta subunit/fumarate hydratase class I family protein
MSGRDAGVRSLNDIDFIVDSFEHIPQSLAGEFLFRHVHPFDPPGKTLVQSIDPETMVRVDVFAVDFLRLLELVETSGVDSGESW